MKFTSIRKAKAEMEKVKTHTGSKIRFLWFSKGEMIETNWNRDGPRLSSDNLRRGCRLQDGDAVQGWSESRWRVIAHRRGGREARLARGGIREHDALLGYEMRGPAGPASDWAWWRLDGWGAGRPRRKEGKWGEGPSLAITTMVCSEFA